MAQLQGRNIVDACVCARDVLVVVIRGCGGAVFAIVLTKVLTVVVAVKVEVVEGAVVEPEAKREQWNNLKEELWFFHDLL